MSDPVSDLLGHLANVRQLVEHGIDPRGSFSWVELAESEERCRMMASEPEAAGYVLSLGARHLFDLRRADFGPRRLFFAGKKAESDGRTIIQASDLLAVLPVFEKEAA